MKLFETPERKDTEFNPRKHPEIEEGEMFLTNVSEHEINEFLSHCKYDSKRIGKIAYDINSGEKTMGFLPVFISKEEYEEFKDRKKGKE